MVLRLLGSSKVQFGTGPTMMFQDGARSESGMKKPNKLLQATQETRVPEQRRWTAQVIFENSTMSKGRIHGKRPHCR